jgi:hypothetical protein
MLPSKLLCLFLAFDGNWRTLAYWYFVKRDSCLVWWIPLVKINYLGSQDQGDHISMPAWVKKKKRLKRPHLRNLAGVVVHVWNSSYLGGVSKKIAVHRQSWAKE